MNKIRVGMLSASMSRTAGGIAPSMRALSASLVVNDIDVAVFAARDAESDKDLGLWGNLPVRLHEVRGPRAFGWQRGLNQSLAGAKVDVLHKHGLWMYPSLVATGFSENNKPRVISPHGMLDPWALQNSAAKKSLAMALFERRNLAGAACLHALCAAERDAIRSCGINVPIAVIPNGVDLSEAEGPFPKPNWSKHIPNDAKVLLYLGRIHPKKGIEPLLDAIALLRATGAARWHLVVAGWDQGGTEAKLVAKVSELGLEQRVHFVGPQYGINKKASYARADAFVLPSFSEGLPMTVLEAWSFRLPVLMTKACNLPEGFASGAAFRITTDPAEMAHVLDQVIKLDKNELRFVGYAGRKLVEERFTWSTVAEQMAAVYRWVLDGGEAPPTVQIK
ncbi:glycosyltransferase [Falsihalocynthiibacter sp. BN13B15]|uniref:glycosyltransferase n=1 Tax=Falsihalocynthiibacter sp. BN13B15 TaxID=3240871 RepID=UPI00351007A3